MLCQCRVSAQDIFGNLSLHQWGDDLTSLIDLPKLQVHFPNANHIRHWRAKMLGTPGLSTIESIVKVEYVILRICQVEEVYK